MTDNRSGPYTRGEEAEAQAITQQLLAGGLDTLISSGRQQVITSTSGQATPHDAPTTNGPHQLAARVPMIGHGSAAIAQDRGLSDLQYSSLKNVIYQEALNSPNNRVNLQQNNAFLQSQEITNFLKQGDPHHVANVQVNQSLTTNLHNIMPQLPEIDSAMGVTEEENAERGRAKEKRRNIQQTADRFNSQKLPTSVAPTTSFANTNDALEYLEQKCLGCFPPILQGVCPDFIQIQITEHMMSRFLGSDQLMFQHGHLKKNKVGTRTLSNLAKTVKAMTNRKILDNSAVL